jgi:hypothetical protein
VESLRNWRALFAIMLWLVPCTAQAQNFTRQLPSDADGGSILGVHQYGRQLSTDPDKGEGYSYFVYPGNLWGPGVPLMGFGAAVPTSGEGGIHLEEAAGENHARPAPTSLAMPQLDPLRYFTFDATRGLKTPQMPKTARTIGQAITEAEVPALVGRDLVQVKVRVVEVEREDSNQIASVLDYISTRLATAPPSFIVGNNINMDRQNTRFGSRFPTPLGISGGQIGMGQGMLFNLTTQHINYIASILATEFHGDLVTAPEVVTLNGQNVEFVSGAKLPFELGQNVVNGSNNNVQQFFYKHVGAYVSVKPTMIDDTDLIELEIVVRTSNGDTQTTTVTVDGKPQDRSINFENNVRAVANVIQVKNGCGVVMAGLIGEHETKNVSKVPVLGDIPIIGAAFRSKVTDRRKTEVLVFVEARSFNNSCEAKCESARDFILGQAYVLGEFLDNPLEEGLHQAGMGAYLPPCTLDEARFWEKLGRKVRRAATSLCDALE